MTTPQQLRVQARAGQHRGPTSGLCEGYLQTNLVILDRLLAPQFRAFCRANSQPCPLLAELGPGETEPASLAPGSDVRSDLPLYRVFRDGLLVEEVSDISHLFNPDMCSFFLGCSFSFEKALQAAGIPIRNVEEKRNVSMYQSSIKCTPHSPFACDMVVSMRPMSPAHAEQARKITAQMPQAHGAPVHVGSPEEIGIADVGKPDFGDAVTIKEGEVPVFWACGVTSSVAALSPKKGLVITHAPGCMFVSDLPDLASRALFDQLNSN